LEANFIIRTVASWNANVACVGDPSYDHRVTGIKRGSLFNELKYLHAMQYYSVDVMRDFLEGIALFELSLVFAKLHMSGFISLENLNLAISFFQLWPKRQEQSSTYFVFSALIKDVYI
jgi:hypothetical protein